LGVAVDFGVTLNIMVVYFDVLKFEENGVNMDDPKLNNPGL
jgi:hypothetical protein